MSFNPGQSAHNTHVRAAADAQRASETAARMARQSADQHAQWARSRQASRNPVVGVIRGLLGLAVLAVVGVVGYALLTGTSLLGG